MSKLQWLWLPVIVIGVVTCRAQEPRTGSTAHHEDKSITGAAPSASQGVPIPGWKPDPEIEITRTFAGKKRTFTINPNHEGGEPSNAVWEQEVSRGEHEAFDRILQLSPTVLCYEEVPGEVAEDFHHISQPVRLEFMDNNFRTVKEVDIWKSRPYQDMGGVKVTYWDFNAEEMDVLPYKEQNPRRAPTEYTLFTSVRSEGSHVIVNYELRGMDEGEIVSVTHTLRIYDLSGMLKYELKDLSSVDGAVVSNDGRYMMYTFGGSIGTVNSPFATMEREGWALMRLADRKIVYKEYTDDGRLAFNRIWMEQGYLRLSYSTPSEKIDYDYWIFFDCNEQSLYKHFLTDNERVSLTNDDALYKASNWIKYVISKFDLEAIPILTK